MQLSESSLTDLADAAFKNRMAGAEDAVTTIIVITVWMLAAPKAIRLVTNDIIGEKIFAGFTAMIDRKFRGTLLGYLFRCRKCFSHWVGTILWIFYIPAWGCMKLCYAASAAVSFILLVWAVSSSHDLMEDDDEG